MFHQYRQHLRNVHLGSDGRHIHEKTLYAGLVIVKGLVRRCARKRNLPHHPLAEVRLDKPSVRPAYCPDITTVKSIVAASDDDLAVIPLPLALTGMRSGELQLLRRKDVDLAGNGLTIQTLKAN